MNSLREMLRGAAAGRKKYDIIIGCIRIGCIIMGCMALSFAGIVSYAAIKGPRYTTSMTVREQGEGSSTASMASDLLSRLPLPLGNLNRNSLLPSYIHLLSSLGVADVLLRAKHIDLLLYGKRVDPNTGEWVRNWLLPLKQFVYSAFGRETDSRPTADDVASTLKTMLVVDQDQLTNLVTIHCTAAKPATCRDVLLMVHAEAQAQLNGMRRATAIEAKSYYEKVLPTISNREIRDAVIASLLDTDRQIAMSDFRKPVGAILIIDPPRIPSQPSFPKPPFLILIGFLIGLSSGIGLAWLIGDEIIFGAVPARRIAEL